MSFNAIKTQMGQPFIFVVDVFLDQNDVNIDFSSDPGSYNTPRTTQDPAAYNQSQPLKLYRFSNVDLGPSAGIHFPILKSISTTPPVLNDSIGLRASANIVLNDTNTNDVYELPEPYQGRRVTGSFIFKWLSRNYLHNRPVKIHYGFDPRDFNLDNFISESYIINTISGPEINGEMSINVIDPLIWASRQKSKISATEGTLKTEILTGVTAIIIDDYPDPDSFPASGYIRIEKEILAYTNDGVTGTEIALTITGRGEWGSAEDDHEIGVTVTDLFFAIDINVTYLIQQIFNLSGISDDLIDLLQFEDARNNQLASHNYTGIVSQATGAQDVIKDLLSTSSAKVYWNTITNKVNLKAVEEFDAPSYTIDALNDIKPDTLQVSFAETEQITRQAVNWARIDATSTDADNFARRFTFIDDIAESAARYAKENELQEIKTNWLPGTTAGDSLATGIAQLQVEKRADMPIEISGQIGVEHIGNPGFLLADFIQIQNIPNYTGPDLSPNSLNCQVTKLTSNGNGTYSFTALALRQPEQGETIDYVIDNNQENITLTDLAPPIAGRETVVLINAGVTIGSTTVTQAALKTGNYPDGLYLRNRGLILGQGGDGASVFDNVITPALNGGNALQLDCNTRIDNGAGGLIWAGGGGGQASTIIGANPAGQFRLISGSGGGGGQGHSTSQGGTGDPIGAQPPGQVWPGGDGTDGNNDGPGIGGSDISFNINKAEDGGAYGQSTDGANAGYSILTNSFIFSITDGNNSFQIKGAIL